MQRRRFTEEFNREAVKLASQPGASTAAIAHDLGINANLLGRWKRERDESGGQSVTGNAASVSPAEFERMRRELAKVKMERDILKKALGLFAAEPSLRTPLLPGIAMSGQRARCAVSLGFPPAVL